MKTYLSLSLQILILSDFLFIFYLQSLKWKQENIWTLTISNISSSLIHKILVFLLLLFYQGTDQLVQKPLERRVNRAAAFFDASFINLHVGCGLHCSSLFVLRASWQMMRKCNALTDWDIQSFRELLNPEVGISLWFWVISIENYNDSLSLFLDCWPNSLVFRIAFLKHKVTWNIPELDGYQTIVDFGLVLHNSYVSCWPVGRLKNVWFLW